VAGDQCGEVSWWFWDIITRGYDDVAVDKAVAITVTVTVTVSIL
jgi:hypothetical protein